MPAVIVLLVVLTTVGVGIAAASVIDAFVLSVLWGWFAVPLFQLPPLGMAAAWGVALTIRTIRPSDTDIYKTGKRDTDWFKVLSVLVFAPAITLLFGWIAKSLM